MSVSLLEALIIERIQAHGPMPFAEFMDLALYHHDFGYYARATRLSGRAGDFFTSVDVGPVFGELLARQFAEMWRLMGRPSSGFDLVEGGAGSGQLARDILDGAHRDDPAFYEAIRLHLVESSPAARACHREMLGPHADRLATSGAALPDAVEGIIYANELLDALPCHAVVMREDGLREIVVDVEASRLVEREAPPSTSRIAAYLEDAGVELRPGWRAEVNLQAVEWVRRAAGSLSRGFLLLIDYGQEAVDLYSAAHSSGTRTTFHRHIARDEERAGVAPWLEGPGECDITAHVDLTAITRAATDEGLTTLGRLDQTYFLLGLGLAEMIADAARAARIENAAAGLKRRLALKTLMLPGGLGSTFKVLIFGKDVGRPSLRGCSFGSRLT